jgi:hypothetical protein
MKSTVNKTLVRSFYIQYAGFFLFLFIVFFGIVAPSQQPAYHYALIRGMLAAPVFLWLVAGCWLLYAIKIVQFVRRVLESPEGAGDADVEEEVLGRPLLVGAVAVSA